jgi:hypothetical protein
METINVKPWGKDQGDFVVINKADFDPKRHELLDEDAGSKSTGKPSDGLKVEEIKDALAKKGVAIPDGVTLKADLAALLDAS